MYQLTVTIVTYKTDLHLLKKALQSVIEDCFDAYLIIVDNNSGKVYFDALKENLHDFNVNLYSTKKNGGYGYGHNYAEKHCPPSRFHLVMNADIVVHKGSLIRMLDYMKKNSDISILSPKVLNPDGSLQYLNKREPTVIDIILRRLVVGFLAKINFFQRRMHYYEMRDIGYDTNYNLTLASGCFMLFDRKSFIKAKGFDEVFFMYFEDFDLSKRIIEFGGRIAYFSDSQVTHYWERSSSKNFFLFMSLIKSSIIYFNRWGWKLW